ncbi:MAG: type II toxin-antitoxin system HicB family antitoxin [Chloroflexi bacterium]|nr:type II toxin-antitoxin system HicB family antitoxin [Chloroflexota bacterium]
MLTEYIEAAMKRARCRVIGDDTYFGEIPGFQGVWSNANSPEECLRELREVLEDWIVLGLRHDDPMPEVDGLTLTLKKVEDVA